MPTSVSSFSPRKVVTPPLLTGEDGPVDLASFYTDQQNRIPNGADLEMQSSDVIRGLLGTPEGAMFGDTSRMAAERATGQGVSGSPNAFGVGLKMSDEERLRRISLGQNFLSAAYNRNPALDPSYQFMTPAQKAGLSQDDKRLLLDKERLDLQKKASELDNILKLLNIRSLTPAVEKGTHQLDPGAFGTSGTKPAYVNPWDDYLKGMIGSTGGSVSFSG